MKSNILKRFLQTEANQTEKEKQRYSDFGNNNNFMRNKQTNHSMYNYNVKDFLPSNNKNTSFSINNNKGLERRVNTCKEQALSQNQTITKFPISQVQLQPSKSNVLECRQQTQTGSRNINELIQQNRNLKDRLNQQLEKNKKQQDQIQNIKKELAQLQSFQTKNLKFWSNKISVQLLPIKKHSYEISIQTENFKQETEKKPKSLKAKDFEQLYRKFNINLNNPSKTFQKNNSNLGNNYSHTNPYKNFSKNVNNQQNRISNEDKAKNFLKNDSLFKPVKNVMSDFEAFLNDNKQNRRNLDNTTYNTKNNDGYSFKNIIQRQREDQQDQLSISMNNKKKFSLPAKQTSIVVYPIGDDEIEDIISQLMEKQFD